MNRQKELDTPLALWRIGQAEVAVRGEHAGRAVDGVSVVRCVLVAKPQRQPGAVWALLAREVRKCRRIGPDRSEGVSGEIGPTSVEGQGSPTAAECWEPTIAVL